MAETAITFSPAWLKTMNERARKCCQGHGSFEVRTGYYAARKIRDKWEISHQGIRWHNPVVVHEIHEYPDGDVRIRNYIEGVQLYARRNIQDSGMRAVRPSELPDLLGIAKVVYFDHRKIDEKGRALRVVRDLREMEAAE